MASEKEVEIVAEIRPTNKSGREKAKIEGNARFLWAAKTGNMHKVLAYLDWVVDINTCNPEGVNALHLSSNEGHTAVVTELLRRGANVNAASKEGVNALHYSSNEGHTAVVTELLKRGANINAAMRNGHAALHIAALVGQENMVKILVKHGATVNVQSQENGLTPLHMAVMENHTEVVKFLLANGGNPSLTTTDGISALGVAKHLGHDKVIAVLEKYNTREKEAESEDLMVIFEKINIKCPITQQVMTNPIKNKHCGHAYDRAGIEQLIKHRAEKARCPILGCSNAASLCIRDMVPDMELRSLIQSKQDVPGTPVTKMAAEIVLY